MKKGRIYHRVAFRSLISFGPEAPPEHTSFITDLSDRGTHIKTNSVYKPGTKIYMVIESPDSEYAAEGVVVWAKKAPVRLAHIVKCGMGVEFTRIDPALSAFYQEQLEMVA